MRKKYKWANIGEVDGTICIVVTLKISHYLNITVQLLKLIKGETDIIALEADYQINRQEPRKRDWTRQIVCMCNFLQYCNGCSIISGH